MLVVHPAKNPTGQSKNKRALQTLINWSIYILYMNKFCVKMNVGVAVGCGWQTFVAYVNVGCYYFVGIPIGAILGFKFNLGVKVYLFTSTFFKIFLV